MAGYNKRGFLFVSSFIGFCVLIIAAAGGESNAGESLKFEEIRYMLQNYANPSKLHASDPIKEFAQEFGPICEPYVAKCSRKEFDRTSSLVYESKWETNIESYEHIASVHYADRKDDMNVPKLSEYAQYCKSKLINYCIDNIDEVGFMLLAGVSEDNKKLVRPLLESLQNAGIRGNAREEDAINAFSKLKESLYGDRNISADEESKLRRQIHYALVSLRGVYSSFGKYLSIESQDKAAPKGDIILTDWFNLASLDAIFKGWLPAEDRISEHDWLQDRVFKYYGLSSDGAALLEEVKKVSSEPEKVERMLQDYRDERVRIESYSIRQFLNWCEPTLDKCSHPKFKDFKLAALTVDFGHVLYGYANYCLRRVENYCVKNVHQVSRLFLTGISEDDKRLARSFLEFIPIEKLEDPFSLTMKDVLAALKHSVEAEKKISTNVNINFGKRAVNAFDRYRELYQFYHYQIKSHPATTGKASPDGDILITNWFNLSELAHGCFLSLYRQLQQHGSRWIDKI